jgi:3-isopropylmalate/(R)-2-methylmalate dehydratase small subunit
MRRGRCWILAFAALSFNNCFKNGILPLTLPKENVAQLMHAAQSGTRITVDLDKQTVQAAGQNTPAYAFTIEPFRKHCLMNGLDDIGLSLQKLDAIAAYEVKQKQLTPWLAA